MMFTTMRRFLAIFFTLLLVISSVMVMPINPARAEPAIPSTMIQVPTLFIENRGQLDDSVHYYIKSGGRSVYFTEDSIVFSLSRYIDDNGEQITAKQEGKQVERLVFSMDLLGTSDSLFIEGRDMAPGKVNYLIGNDPSQWHTNVPLYSEVIYTSVYPNTDLRLYDDAGTLRYDFIVRPL